MNNFALIQPILRHVLQAIGGALVAAGYLDEEMIPAIVGLGINGAALAWYLYNKFTEKKA